MDTAVQTLEPYAPGIAETIIARYVVTPADLEREYGLSGGHRSPRRSAVCRRTVYR